MNSKKNKFVTIYHWKDALNNVMVNGRTGRIYIFIHINSNKRVGCVVASDSDLILHPLQDEFMEEFRFFIFGGHIHEKWRLLLCSFFIVTNFNVLIAWNAMDNRQLFLFSGCCRKYSSRLRCRPLIIYEFCACHKIWGRNVNIRKIFQFPLGLDVLIWLSLSQTH